MKVDILASGSKGNCIALTSNQSTILIDAGIAKTKIEKALLDVGIKATDISAIFITHAHKDHTKGLPIANKYKIPVYASEDEWKDIDLVDDELVYTIDTEVITFGDIHVYAFETYHDAYDPVGYVVKTDECKVSICLDTGKVDEHMLNAMLNSDIYIIEANYDEDMLQASNYPESVKERISSDVGHLSNKQTASALSKLIQGRGEKILLTHLSSNNNLPVLAEMTVKRALKRKGLVAGKHYKLEVIS